MSDNSVEDDGGDGSSFEIEARLSELELLGRKDIRETAKSLTLGDVRRLVNLYYDIQDYRKTAAQRSQAREEQEQAHALIEHVFGSLVRVEADIKIAMDIWSQTTIAGLWLRSVYGIGPVLAAGFMAHIDITKARTAGAVWRFAGLDPTLPRAKKGEKRRYNARLKVLCWKAGDSFVKFSNKEKCVYGHIYRERKLLEVERDAQGVFAPLARRTLEEKEFRDREVKALYESGHLPAGRLELRARRYAVKLFLSHFHWVLHECYTGEPPPRPYVIEHLGHAHLMSPPGWPLE